MMRRTELNPILGSAHVRLIVWNGAAVAAGAGQAQGPGDAERRGYLYSALIAPQLAFSTTELQSAQPAPCAPMRMAQSL